jgi:hypothetical protein
MVNLGARALQTRSLVPLGRFALVVAVAATIARGASADPVASTETPRTPATEPVGSGSAEPLPAATATDVADAPLPGQESGRTDTPDHDSVARRVGRVALFPLRLLADLALDPLRGAVYAEDHYHVTDVYYRTFYNKTRTVGVVPTATWATGLGFTAGARFVDHDTFGDHEVFAAEATSGIPPVAGYNYHQSVSASLDSGSRYGRVKVGIAGNFDRRPEDPFYGIGNGDVVKVAPGLIDPLTESTAIYTTYRYQEARVASFADVRLVDHLHLRATGALADHQFSESSIGIPTNFIYNTADIVGWNGFSNLYGELDLRYDTRHRATNWEPHDLHSTGFLADVAVGRVHELDAGDDYWRGIAELQEFWRIGKGPRMLAFRLRGETVSGPLDQIPFSELPMLGGGDFLRGYNYEQYRDRVAMLGSVEYVWDVSKWFDAAVFTDVGRVYDSLDDLSVDALRLGYGVALEVNDDNAFLFEFSVASSIDGGLYFNLALNPVYDNRPRWR